VLTGQTATFTGPGDIKNVISRVTGGEISNIEGKLASKVGQADLYFLNPAGVVFGSNATLDVPGSFHVSTAHELRFADGARFSALDKTGSGLTVAPPEAFGFLDRPSGRIAVDQSQLQLDPGKTLSLVGGDLMINGGKTGRIIAEDGAIHLVSAARPSTVQIADAITTVSPQGDVRVSQHSSVRRTSWPVIDASGLNGGGKIRIHGGRLTFDSAQVYADNHGSQASTGGIDLNADRLVSHDSLIQSVSFGTGKAGTVAVTARELELRQGSQIASVTLGPGDGGQVTVQADRLLVSGDNVAGYTSGAFSSAEPGSTGHAGTVTVTARELELRDGGRLFTATFESGAGGQITVKAGRLLVSGISAVKGFSSGILSTAAPGSTGHAGTVVVTARELELHDGPINANTFGSGDGGQVTVNADHLLVSGDGRIDSSAQAGSTGHAGTVAVTAHELELHDGGWIASNTRGSGNGGQVRSCSQTGRAGRCWPGCYFEVNRG
jgi:filamentous hemagglutinin family protein